MLTSRLSFAAACSILLLFLASPANAFTVSPMLGEIDLSRSGSTTLRIVNDGDTVLRVEARVFERKQDDSGQYAEAPTKALMAFPPVMEIPANSNRALRLMVRPGARDQATQSYYTLHVIQLGERTSTVALQEQSKKTTVKAQIVYTFHIPIYVYPKTPIFSLKIERAKVDTDRLTTWVENDGTSIVRMKDIRAFIRIGSEWRPAHSDPPPRVKAIVVGNVIPLEWNCTACVGTVVSGVRIEGKAPHWGKFTMEKIW